MGKADINNHTKDYIHIRKRTAGRFIAWSLATIIIFGLDVLCLKSALDSVWGIIRMQILAIVILCLFYSVMYYDSDGNYIG